MEFVSLNAIVYDLLNIIRASQLTDDEPISPRQVEAWIHQYRALFIKRDLDKGKKLNPDYVQTMSNVPLEYDSDMEMYRTSIELPTTIDLNHQSGITAVIDSNGNQIQLVPESRAVWQKYKRVTQDDTIAFLKNFRLYLCNPKGLSFVSFKGVFEIPPVTSVKNGEIYTINSYYPIPISILPTLKQEILKSELGIEWDRPVDKHNDADHELEK